jgi:hypothetical protein
MKLGIVVVYLVSPENEKLLDLHLDQIKKFTSVSYTIYGSINRLLPYFRQKLAKHPEITICTCQDTEERGAAEHAHYLEQLTKFAIEDGATHIVTMHVDSFPIRHHWAEELVEMVNGSVAFATIENINTACLFFTRDFYLRHQPRFTLSPKEHASTEYWKYQNDYNPIPHSGIGYGFRAHTRRLSWHYLRKSAQSSQGFCCIYDNMIFHLVAASDVGGRQWQSFRFLKKPVFAQMAENIIVVGKRLISLPTREKIRILFRGPIELFLDRPRILAAQEKLATAKRDLLNDPESYIHRLQAGKK